MILPRTTIGAACMKIRTKLAIIEVLLVIGVAVAITVVISFTNLVVTLKNFEVKSERLLASLDDINRRTGTLLTTNNRLSTEREEIQKSITQFEESLTDYSTDPAVRFLGTSQEEALYEALSWWRHVASWYFRPAFSHIDSMVDRGMEGIISDRGVFQTFLLLRQQDEAHTFQGDYDSLRNYQLVILQNSSEFQTRMDRLIAEIQNQSERTIVTSTRTAIIIVAVSLLFTIFLTSRFSLLMVRRIKQIGKAMETISRGDFSDELKISSGDEFEDLSRNYNALKNQLKEKLDSVLSFMFQIGSLQAQDPDPESVLALVVESAVENTEADAGALFLVDKESKSIYVADIIGLFPPPFPFPEAIKRKKEMVDQLMRNRPIRMGETVIGECIQSGQARFIRRADLEEPLNETLGTLSENDPLYLSSMMLVPLSLPGRMLGAIAVARTRKESFFSDLDFTHMQTFADYAALTIDSIYTYTELIGRREIQREIEIAAGIQKDLLPRHLPEPKNARLAAFSAAAKGVSGDYYDSFPLGSGKIAVVICDVVGKGVPAAMLMVMIRTILRLTSTGDRKPAQILTFLNKGITGKIGVDHFATMGMFMYDETEGTIYFSNAAHPPLLIYREAAGEFIELDTPGLPIGIEVEEKYTQRKFATVPGDLLLFYTDGVTETRSRDGREYGMDAFKSVIRSAASMPPQKIVERIREDLLRFAEGAEQHDDQTFIVMKRV
jgi:phosphoserine phosphatase RsbU/P